MTAFDALLELQEHDTAGDRLVHRLAHLPERAAVAEIETRLGALDASLAEARKREEECNGRQVEMEQQMDNLGRRVNEIERRMYSGDVSATRELLAMGHEVDSLKARRSAIEDDALAAMEEGEPLLEHVAALEAERAVMEVEITKVRAALADAERETGAQLTHLREIRADVAERVSADLVATYERLRAELGGVGAARMVGNSCSGCHLTLPAYEVARIKREPPDALVMCDQCGRILVR